jgi:hypothetical protein
VGAEDAADHDDHDLKKIVVRDALTEGRREEQEGKRHDAPTRYLAPPVVRYLLKEAHSNFSNVPFCAAFPVPTITLFR